jgi:hypothetical protein
MKHINIFLIAILIVSPLFLSAQSSNNLPTSGISLSYLGSMQSPGFKIGYVKALVTNDSFDNTKSYTKERYLSYNLGMYHKPTFHDNFFAQLEWNLRHQRNKGFYYEFTPGVGLSRTFLSSATYEVDNTGNVSKEPMAGNFYALASLSGSVGYNLSLNTSIPGKIFVKPGLIFLFPYNKLAYTRPMLELGYMWNFK